MHNRNLKSKKNGFILVEVIVVAIIVAAMAAVAIPVYTSYVSSSRTNAASNAAGSVASYLGSCKNSEGTVGHAGYAAGDTTAGTSALILTCLRGTTQISSMQIPIGIKVSISDFNFAGTGPFTVSASHVDGGSTAQYGF